MNLPETAVGVLALAVVVGYWLLRDRSAFLTQHEEISSLRKALIAQSERHAVDVASLNAKLDVITRQYDDQRAAKHKANNDVAKTVMALDLVQRLARECSCGVLDPLTEIVDRLVAELSSITRTTSGEA